MRADRAGAVFVSGGDVGLTGGEATGSPRSSAAFIALIALTTSLVAMSIDTMLPAIGTIATDLGARHPNDRQLILTAFFGGLTVGQLVYGPISDSTGRKPALFAGIGLMIAAGVVCALTTNFELMLVARALQGLGAAAPRIVPVAMVRDLYAGRGMARIMSFVSSVFILVPIVAPSVGQGILLVAHWRVIFWAIVLVAVIVILWYVLGQDETLPPARRATFSPGAILRGSVEVFKNRITFGYMVATGFILGGLINYLSTSQQIFQEQYDLGKLFPIAFGTLAFSIGLASFANGKLVMRFGMRQLSKWALRVQCTLSLVFLVASLRVNGHPPFSFFMGYMIVCFFCNGLLFGNFNARAMEPMGHMAGIAAAVIGSLSNLLGIVIGTALGRAYDGTIIPLVAGYAAFGIGALIATESAERVRAPARHDAQDLDG